MPRSAYRSARQGLSLASDWNAAAGLIALAPHRLQRDVLIVLDDFHALAAPSLTESMIRWIDSLPPRAHLAILTRVVPDLPLARWRAQGRLAELGPDDLCFTVPELRALLVDLNGLPLSDSSLHVVAAKTEGWPVGIVLALHAARAKGAAAASQVLRSLTGSTREIYEYLALEAFARQPSETQQFMMATAAVTRFSIPLAGALLGTTAGRTREILDHLERSHLFIVPLDRERRWYRYHHLFQEFLQRTAAEREPDRMREVHRTAAAWWEREGEAVEALSHLVEAGQCEHAAVLLERVGLDMVAKGHLEPSAAEDAVRIARSSHDDWIYLGCVRYKANFLEAVGRFREAEILFEEMLGLTRRRAWWHEHAHFRVELAGALLSVGRTDEAELHLAEARLPQPGIPCRVLHADLALAAGRSAVRREGGRVRGNPAERAPR
ncbi:MAG: hypothetical protein QN187_11175 [Armatimonadota bacterium]|nr:hypothetical protein [Armatimonadota bacterium]MDR7550167.1 hypothetical protein [Armatimonadota bacterium]